MVPILLFSPFIAAAFDVGCVVVFTQAAERGHTDIARMLLECDRALLGVKDKKGNVPNVDV